MRTSVGRSGLAAEEMESRVGADLRSFPMFSVPTRWRGELLEKERWLLAPVYSPVDLWRLQTGRVTLENLGLKPAQSY